MQIDDKLISYLEDLSCLTLADADKSRLTTDLQKMLNGVSKLCELNTAGAGELSLQAQKDNVLRDDIVRPSFNRELILKNASVKNDEFFLAPKTME